VILLDTSVVIECFTGTKVLMPKLRAVDAQRETIALPALVIYEWLRGPRTSTELALQEELFPIGAALVFGPKEAALSADLYRSVRRARSREIDIAIAACAIVNEAQLWTLNRADFADIPGLRLYDPKA
jgi:predicted nucleic acid-binding protein